MGQTQIIVANQQLSLSFDCDGCPGGTLVRLEDGLEARFSSPECLLHLLEGMLGRRAWQQLREHVEAQIARLIPCA